MISRPFAVDNHRPRLEGLTVEKGESLRVRGVAVDSGSVLTRVEYRVDGSAWTPVAATDGVLDSNREPFAFTLTGLEKGLHRLWVRVWDRAANTGVAMLEFSVE
jgi:hypothetical protein